MAEPCFRFWGERDLQDLPPPRWLVEHVLPEHGLGVLYGPSGVGKSYVALSLAISVACGIDWLGRRVESGRVVYIAAEGIYGLGPRLTALKHWHDIPRIKRLTIVPDPVHMHNEQILAAYLDQLKMQVEPNIALTVIDTLSRCSAGSDESSNAHRELTVEGMNAIRRVTQGAVMAIHHTGWKEDHMRGGSALQAAADFVLALKKIGGGIDLRVEKQRDAEDGGVIHLALARVAGNAVITSGKKQGVPLTEQQSQVLYTLTEIAGTTGASTMKWQRSVGIPQSSFFAARKRLLKEEYISETTQGLNVPSRLGLELLQLQGYSKVLQNGAAVGPLQSLPSKGTGDGATPGESDADELFSIAIPPNYERFRNYRNG